MKVPKMLIALLIVCVNARAQAPIGLDTAIKGRITRILELKDGQGGYHPNPITYGQVRYKAKLLLSKFDFLNAIIADSYYGGEKPNKPLKNDLLKPSAKANVYMNIVIKYEPKIVDNQLNNDLDKIDSTLNSFYITQVKNRYKNATIRGDDDENMLVEVKVKVLESYSRRKEVAGFDVFCESPFVKNYKENFGTTTNAKRKISAGYRLFTIKKGPVTETKLVRIVFGDPNTYQVIFSNDKVAQI